MPSALHACFDELCQVVRPVAEDCEIDLLAEVPWSGLHGLVTPTRLPPCANPTDCRWCCRLRRLARWGDTSRVKGAEGEPHKEVHRLGQAKSSIASHGSPATVAGVTPVNATTSRCRWDWSA
ncbi:hypothetical protein Acsp04_58560 [Actinomadura sp. NBRC 104425]|nr:hypothetical protein Acsp04_58560 [Actinomadura sp. NBRC 104425]